jgi:hypothetical protein
MRLSFGMQSPAKIEEGISVLGRVVRRHLGHRDLSAAGRASRPFV